MPRTLEHLRHDVRLAVRTLGRSRVFTIVTALILALAVGANGAVFALLNAVLRTPPAGVTRSPSLVWVANAGRFSQVSVEYYRELHTAASQAIDLAASVPASVAFVTAGEPTRLPAQLVSANYFSVLGVAMAAGRAFAPDEDRPETEGAFPVAVLSHELWMTRFRGDRSIVGTAVSINGQRFDVIGVAAPEFTGLHLGAPAALWVPTAMRGVVQGWDARLFGRLRNNVSQAQATAVLQATARGLETDPRFAERTFTPELAALEGWVRLAEVQSLLPIVAIAWVIAGIVLLVVAANIANLMMVRSVRRGREIGIRVALGSGRWGVMRLLVVESVVLAVAAGALGVMFAYWGAWWFRARFGAALTSLSVAPDAATLSFTLLLAMGAGVLVGAAPAWRASRPDVLRVIKGDQSSWLQRGRLQALLVMVQVALSVVLVVTAGLFVRRLMALGTVRPGFDAAHTVSFSFDPYAQRYSTDARNAFHERVRGRLASSPGVAAVTVPTFVPLGDGAILSSAYVPESGLPLEASASRFAVMSVGAGYFRTLGATLLDGRDFTEQDMLAEPRVAVVSESFARRWWPNERAVGRRFGIDTVAALVEVIGVARDMAFSGVGERPFAHAYVPYSQGRSLAETHILVRTHGDPAAVVPAIRAELRAIDPTLPVFNVRTLADAVEEQMAAHRTVSRVVGSFGALALLLASVGLYGIVAFGVTSRTREIGIRVALGARPGSVVGLFVRDGLRLALLGVVVGSVLAVGGAHVLTSAVGGLEPTDPVMLAGIAAVLTITVGLASWLSARRAGEVDPMVALRDS